jgi:Zn-dependent protease
VWAVVSYNEQGDLSRSTHGIAVFAVVVVGWIVSLCLHEFGHALSAFRGGDTAVAERGYLTLDPRRYTDLVTSLVIPLVFIVIGGIGLPGGAVWIRPGAIRTRWLRSVTSLAGPAMNAIFAAGCIAAARLVGTDRTALFCALSFLALLQCSAVVLNLLPIPGLDGFGAIEPWLSGPTVERLAPMRKWSFFGVFALFAFVPAVGDAFWSAVEALFGAVGGDELGADVGQFLFRFWE